MSRGGGALKQLLGSLGIKAPWKVRREWLAWPPGPTQREGGRGRATGELSPTRPPLVTLPSLLLQYTGPVSSPEYMPHLPKATDYRRVAPT